MEKKNLILGTGFQYGINELKIFIESWKKFASNNHLILVMDPFISQETAKYLQSNNVDIRIFSAAPFIPSAIHNTRYFKYLDIVMEQGLLFNKIFLTDVRDVVFQGDIFSQITESGLHCFQEDSNWTCNEDFNRTILINNYGEEIADQLKDLPIICSGTTLGDFNSIFNYIITLIRERDMEKIIQVGGRPDEQAVHNFILHTNKLQNTKNENGNGVATVGLTKSEDIVILEDGMIQTYRKVSPVVHQWDRHSNLVEHLHKLYF